MKVTIKSTSVYEDDKVTYIQEVDVPEPAPKADLDDWGTDYLLEFTGTGRPSGYAGYFVEVLECVSRPDLVGLEVESFG